MENSIIQAINEIDFTAETPAESKPKKPVCDLFEQQPDRPPVWCNECGRHKNLHPETSADDIEPEPRSPFGDPLGCLDQDTFNAIYRGGNSSPFPYEQEF